MSATGEGVVALRVGTYKLVASAGLEYETDTELTFDIVTGTAKPLTFQLTRVVDRNDGWTSGDFHVHSGQSFDSSIPGVDRVTSFLATGVEILGQTEHDVVGELDSAVAALASQRGDIAQRIKVVKGVESTTELAWITATPLSQPIGHWNAFPLRRDPDGRKKGAPDDELRPAAVLQGQLRTQDGTAGNEIVIMNHPNNTPGVNSLVGTDGYLLALKLIAPPLFNTAGNPISDTGIRMMVDGGSVPGAPAQLVQIVRGSANFDALEVIIGADDPGVYRTNRADWFQMLDRGVVKTALGDTDSHRIDDRFIAGTPAQGFGADHVGTPRNYIFFGVGNARADQITDTELVDALRPTYATPATSTANPVALAPAPFIREGMKSFATTGPLFQSITVSTGTAAPVFDPIGRVISAPVGPITVTVTVEAPTWIMEHVTEIRLIHSEGPTTNANDALRVTPTTVSPTRKTATFTFTPGGTNDAWFILEAGQPLATILLDVGNAARPNAPASSTTYGQVYPRQHVLSWTNPIFLDRDGNPGTFDGPDN